MGKKSIHKNNFFINLKCAVTSLKNKLPVNNPIFHAIVKHSPKYFGASIFNSILSLIMTKYYTKVFTPADYGVLALYLLFIQYLNLLIGFTWDSNTLRVYHDYSDSMEKRDKFFGTVLTFLIVSSTFWCIVLIFTQKFIILNLGGNKILYWISVIVSFFGVFVTIFNMTCINEKMSNLIFRQNISQSILSHAISFLYLYFVNITINIRIISQGISSLLNGFSYASTLIKRKIFSLNFSFDIKVFKNMNHFAIPAFLTAVISTSLSYIDRLLINHYHGASHVGIYSLGMSIGLMFSMAIEAISQAIFPVLMNGLKSNYEQSLRQIKKFDNLFWIGMLFISFCVYFLKDDIIKLISNKNYSDSASVLLFIFLAYTCGGSYKLVSNILSFHRVVWIFPVISTISFGCSAILNFLLIPKYNERGAAFSFFCGAWIYAFIQQIIGIKYYHKWYVVFLFYIGILIIAITFFCLL
jgi:O-antigen/teichoic acid export membrane protein